MDKKTPNAANEKMVEAARKNREAEAAKKKCKAEAARKKREAVAITMSLMESKESLSRSDIEDLTKIAFDIIDWEDSNASTICEGDIKELKETSPQFGVLDERNGRKIYGFFGNHSQKNTIIKKLVVPLYSGVFHDEEKVVPLIEKHFSLTPIHRKKATN